MRSTRVFLSYSLLCNWLINITRSAVFVLWLMHSDGFKGMENREWASERASMWVSTCVCLCAIACVRRPITFPSSTSNEVQRITALPWFDSCKNKSKPWLYACFQPHAYTNTCTREHVLCNSSFHFGGLRAELYKLYSLQSQLLCLAGEDVTKILILDKQIATDSLTGQNLQANQYWF